MLDDVGGHHQFSRKLGRVGAWFLNIARRETVTTTGHDDGQQQQRRLLHTLASFMMTSIEEPGDTLANAEFYPPVAVPPLLQVFTVDDGKVPRQAHH